jgi:hypothetical protein
MARSFWIVLISVIADEPWPMRISEKGKVLTPEQLTSSNIKIGGLQITALAMAKSRVALFPTNVSYPLNNY